MNTKIKKMIHHNIACVMETYGFTGDIIVDVLYERAIENDSYVGVYYFVYEDELYHIIAVYVDNKLNISLNNEIVRAIVS